MKKFLTIAIVIVFSAFQFGCSDSPTGSGHSRSDDDTGSDVVVVDDLDEDIEIGFGQTVLVESEDLEIHFSDVLLDCRCPSGVVCVWEGQAEIELWLTKADGNPDIAVAVIRPGMNPDQYPHYRSYALDYTIVLKRLEPYPEADRLIGKDEYVATIGVEEAPPGGEYDPVIFTWAFPGNLQIDPVEVVDGTITGDTLTLSVRHSGGCGEHSFKLYMRPVFLESLPVQGNCYLVHINHDDPCRAIIGSEVSFDIRPIAELYYDGYHAYDDIMLNIYGYFTGCPSGEIKVLYSPQ